MTRSPSKGGIADPPASEIVKVLGKLLLDARFRVQFQRSPDKALKTMGIQTMTPITKDKLMKIAKQDFSQKSIGNASITFGLGGKSYIMNSEE